MSFMPSVFRVLTGTIVLLAASVFLNIGGDTGSSQALLAMEARAKEKCITIGEKRVCFEDGNKESDNDDDDDGDGGDDDDDDLGKGEKKNGDDAELTECTIQQPGGGGGCKTGFKRVCEK